MDKEGLSMSGQLAVFTALRAIRSELDECERGNLREETPDEILGKYLEWFSTELVNETISILANVENHSIVLGLSMGANIGECLGEYPRP